MSTTAATQTPAFTDEPIFRLTVDQYHELINAGVLTSDDPVELVEGVLLYKTSKKPPHSAATRACRAAVGASLPAGWFYDGQEPITLGDGEPEPDGFVARGQPTDFDDHHPVPADLALVIEVADATLARDRKSKLRSYARASISVYWIVNLIDRQIEVHTDPDPAATPHPTYRGRTVYAGGDAVPLSVGGVELPPVAVAAILPPV